MNERKKASRNVKADFEPQVPIAPDRALAPAMMRLNERRVQHGFWPKIRRVAAQIPFAADALSVWFCARDEETPATAKAMMLAALAYFVMPLDAVPDFIAVLGYTDDAAVFTALMVMIGKNLKPRHRAAAKAAVKSLRSDEPQAPR